MYVNSKSKDECPIGLLQKKTIKTTKNSMKSITNLAQVFSSYFENLMC